MPPLVAVANDGQLARDSKLQESAVDYRSLRSPPPGGGRCGVSVIYTIRARHELEAFQKIKKINVLSSWYAVCYTSSIAANSEGSRLLVAARAQPDGTAIPVVRLQIDSPVKWK